MQILEDVVDVFVICEAPFSFRGQPKPLFFEQAAERFARWRDRIVRLTFEGPPNADPWRNEWGQRDRLIAGLAGCDPDDLILIGDCDEIPDPRNVARRPSPGRILGHAQLMSSGYFNRVRLEPWIGTRSVVARDVERYASLSGVRLVPAGELATVAGGWHFTSIGGAAVMAEKMRAYSHAEHDVPYLRDEYRLATRYDSEHRAQWVPFDEAFPPAVRDDPKWSQHVWNKPSRTVDETDALEHVHGLLAYVPPEAAQVVVVSADAPPWNEAGPQRFGRRFRGVVPDVDAALERASPSGWTVVDGIERYGVRAVERLQSTGAGIVVFLRNARSLNVVRDVAGGSSYPAGRPLGIAEIRAWLPAQQWGVRSVDRIATEGVFLNFVHLPEMLEAEIGTVRFLRITREALADFTARAFVLTLVPPAAAP